MNVIGTSYWCHVIQMLGSQNVYTRPKDMNMMSHETTSAKGI